MHQLPTPREEQPLLTAVASVGDAALLAEVVELRGKNKQLEQALVSRAVIDQARGMVMVLAPCSSERAWDLLVDVSQHCNIKLRDVAAALVATTKGQEFPEAIRREWARALRRLHALERQ
ncbi:MULTISPECIES: ANTAR domain-containing protein [unclassified Streptomyces]|uniref:ANTAR domain-containing protein n=1 Tax=Streptomyces TaxID=1883 RepID=UPI0004C4ED0F|nr:MULTISPECIES: ANTAR domain-containing protein [unclassified Streptomyces]SEC83393.1 ANTAR domain-containing protein [Streptomyces sp. KS_5]SEC88931.1 ANTAR domain-containing protein [Streptomyces sp. PAN_FS17]